MSRAYLWKHILFLLQLWIPHTGEMTSSTTTSPDTTTGNIFSSSLCVVCMCVCVWFCVRIQTLNLHVTCFMLSYMLHGVCYWSLLFVCAMWIYLMWLMSFERALFGIQAKWPRPQHPCQALLLTLSLLYVWVCVSYGVDANQTLPVMRTSHRCRT